MKKFVIMLIMVCAAALSAADAKGADAREDGGVYQLDPLVVVGMSPEDKNREIGAGALEARKVVDLAEILSDELVEVQMIRKGGYGNEVSMRGFGQENLKVMIEDGILEGACGSRKDPPLSHVDMLMVERLEIRQGPFDVTGAGGLGGSVNVITRKPEPGFGGDLLAKGGSYGYRSEGGVIQGGTNLVQGLIGFSRAESGQYEDGDGAELWEVRTGRAAAYTEAGQNADAFRKRDVWGMIRITPGERQTLLLSHTYGKAEDILTPRVVFDTEEEITNLSKASWEIEDLGRFSSKLSVSLYRNLVEHYPSQRFRDVSAPKNNKVESEITGGGLSQVTELEPATFTYGIDFYHQDWWGDVYDSLTGAKLNDKLIPSVESRNIGAYLQAERGLDKWVVTAGLRYDRFTQDAGEELVFSKTVTDENRRVDHLLGWHLSAKYIRSDRLRFFGGIGRTHRTPTAAERYIQGGSAFFGNPALDPAANTEIDLGVRFRDGPWQFRVKAFYSDLSDYIYQENNLSGYKSYVNIDARMWGGDVTASVDLPGEFFLEGGIAYQRGRKERHPDNNDDDDLGQIAPLKGRLSLKYDSKKSAASWISGLLAVLEWTHSEAAEDIDEDAGEVYLPAWDTLNLRGGCRFSWGAFTLGVENLFDETYTVANSYEWDVVSGSGSNPAVVKEPGRFVYASLRIGW